MIRLMTKADIPACMRLKEAAGGSQTPTDWERVIDLQPDGCWVEERKGQLMGSTMVICYGTQLAWVGMVLTLPTFRHSSVRLRSTTSKLSEIGAQRCFRESARRRRSSLWTTPVSS